MSTETNKAVVRSYFERAIEHLRRAFHDIRYAVDDLLAEGDRVVVRVTFRGTHRGEFLGVPATGRPVASSSVEMAELAEGKIDTAGRQYHDELGLLRQLGALPGHGGAPHGTHHDPD